MGEAQPRRLGQKGESLKTILVTGAGGSAAHNFVESLRMAPYKYRIVGTDINPYHIHLTKLDAMHIIPDADSPDYLKRLEEVIESEFVDFVHPQPDMEVSKIAGARLGATTFLPAKEVVDLTHDKMATIKVLSEGGVRTPMSFLVDSEFTVREFFKGNEGKKSWLRATHGAGSRAALPVTRPEEAIGWIDYWENSKGIGWGDFMLSEYLPGADFAWTSLWHEGRLIVSQGRKRLMYLYGFLSPSGTSSTPSVAVTVNDGRVNDTATKAVQAIDPKPHGVYCVDLKEDSNGAVCVTEINAGRFFTTSNFYTHAGVNIPYAYLQLGFGFEPPHYEQYDPLPEGLYWVRMVDMGYRLLTEQELKIGG